MKPGNLRCTVPCPEEYRKTSLPSWYCCTGRYGTVQQVLTPGNRYCADTVPLFEKIIHRWILRWPLPVWINFWLQNTSDELKEDSKESGLPISFRGTASNKLIKARWLLAEVIANGQIEILPQWHRTGLPAPLQCDPAAARWVRNSPKLHWRWVWKQVKAVKLRNTCGSTYLQDGERLPVRYSAKRWYW